MKKKNIPTVIPALQAEGEKPVKPIIKDKNKKSTDSFKQTIQNHLNFMAEQDPLFAVSLKKQSKNIDDCITYILNSVKRSGAIGFTDDEIFGMAMHYYDEDKIDVGNPLSCHVVVNHQVALTEDELREAKVKAINDLIESEKRRMSGKDKPVTKKPEVKTEPDLFG